MKKIEENFKSIINLVLGMRLRYRMLLLYILGGALPIILIAFYLINSNNRLLVEQAKNREITELEMIQREIFELTKTINTISKYFYFDEKLEEIAVFNYTNYEDIIKAYRSYTGFTDYSGYSNNIVSWISIYLENDTIVENANFVKVNEETRKEEWYNAALSKGGGVVWQYMPLNIRRRSELALTRLIKTKKGENVGVLVIYIRPERFKEILPNKESTGLILLNGKTIIYNEEKGIDFTEVRNSLSSEGSGIHQENIIIDNSEYVMTWANIQLIESNDYLQLVTFQPLKEILGEAAKQNYKSAIFFLISSITSIGIIMLFSWSFSERVERFRKQMQKAASGSFELEEKLGGNDEISELYEYLSTMIWEIQRLLTEVYREKLRGERLKTQQKDAEFKMLASQINPHFLYNTLETIRMKARASGQLEIEDLVKMLAKILRSNLQAGNQDAMICSEIELIECYLKIQQYRFGGRIKYTINVEEELKEYRILPLIIQPIVENSIIHGLETKEGRGNVDISISKKEEDIVIAISDDGLGLDEEHLCEVRKNLNKRNLSGNHIGISNVHQRMKLRYGDEYGVFIDSKAGSGTIVKLILPIE